LFKRVLLSVLCLLLATNLAVFVNADTEALSLSYNKVLNIITAFENAYLTMEDSTERYEKYMLMSSYLKADSGIDALITSIENGDDSIFGELADYKDAFIFALCFIKSLPVEQREVSLDAFLAKDEYQGLSNTQSSALTDVYKKIVGADFRNLLEQTYGRNEKVLLSLFSAVKGSFVLTDDKSDTKKLDLKSVDSQFKENLENNLSLHFSTINGKSVSNGNTVLSELIDVVNNGASGSMISDYKAILDALGMYVEYKQPSSPSGGGGRGGGGAVVYPQTQPAVPPAQQQPAVIPVPEVTAQSAAAVSEFNDMPTSHWSTPYVGELIKRNIFQGYDDGSFKPEAGITREEIAVCLVRVLGLEERLSAEFSEIFGDNTDIAEWSKNSVYLLVQMGIFTGYDDGLFRPHNTITRQEFAVVIARAIKKSVALFDVGFVDKNLIEDWAGEGIKKAYSAGIIKGYEDNSFQPDSDITRAEAAAMLYNFMFAEGHL